MPKFSFLLLFAFLISLRQSEVVEIKDSKFDEFHNSNNFYLFLLCSKSINKCKKLKAKLSEVSIKAEKNLNIIINVGYTEIESLPSNSKILENFIFEGFATLYYVNTLENEKEVYLGSKETKNILNYLKFKLISNQEEVKDEKELQRNMKLNRIDYATIFFGNSQVSPFSLSQLSKASKLAGMPKVYIITNPQELERNKVSEWEVAVFNANSQTMNLLNLQEEEDLSVERLTQILLINKRNSRGFFQILKAVDMEYTLNKLVPSLIYIYEDKSQLPSHVEKDITDLAKRYKNEFLFFKSGINSKPLKVLQFKRFFNLTSSDFPALILLAKNINSDSQVDDVEKFILKNSELLAQREKQLKLQKEAKGDLTDIESKDLDDLINKKVVDNFLENFKKGKLYKTYFTEQEENDIKMTGDNFVQVIDNALQDSRAIVLLICPKISKKYKRIRATMQRTFEKIWEINQNQILFDELDPFVNELSLINYEYIPTIALVKKNPDSLAANKWIVDLKAKDFSTNNIEKFIAQNYDNLMVNKTRTDINGEEEEVKYPIWPISKLRLEAKFLSEELIKYDIGFKRRWYLSKKQGLILSDEDLSEFQTFNEWEDDYEPDEYAVYDDLAEKNSENLKLDL